MTNALNDNRPEPTLLHGDSLLREMVWKPANSRFMHVATMRINIAGLVEYKKHHPFQMSFGLGKVSNRERLLSMMFHGDQYRRPKEFTGLSQLYDTMVGARAQNAGNVLDGRGRGKHNASIWLVCWSPHRVYLAYSLDETGDLHAAIVPEDWRYVVRIANIDTEHRDLDLAAIMSTALIRVPSAGPKAVWYTGPKCVEMIKSQMGDISAFRGIPIRSLPYHLAAGEQLITT